MTPGAGSPVGGTVTSHPHTVLAVIDDLLFEPEAFAAG